MPRSTRWRSKGGVVGTDRFWYEGPDRFRVDRGADQQLQRVDVLRNGGSLPGKIGLAAFDVGVHDRLAARGVTCGEQEQFGGRRVRLSIDLVQLRPNNEAACQ